MPKTDRKSDLTEKLPISQIRTTLLLYNNFIPILPCDLSRTVRSTLYPAFESLADHFSATDQARPNHIPEESQPLRRLMQVLSVLEAMLSMPGQEGRMRALRWSLWWDGEAGPVDQRADAVRVVRLPADENFEIVVQSD